jgi:hypothetical protein
MKFIYLSNSIYDIEGLKTNISTINEDMGNENEGETKQELIIYGGNQINSIDSNIDKEMWDSFLSELSLLNSSVDKYILYGGLDLENNEYITKSNKLFGKSNNFNIVPNITYKLIDNSNTLLIFFNNQFKSSTKSDDTLRLNLELEPDKYTNIKSIDNFIEAQIGELGSIFESNINVSSIIFITQSALVSPDYQSKKIDFKRIEENKMIFEWINRYFYLLNNKKLTWICGDFFPRNELGKINIIKSDIETKEQISNLTIFQYIIGLKQKTDFNEFNGKLSEIGEIFNGNYEVGINGLDNSTKWIFDIEYEIDNINNELEYLEYEIDEPNNNLFNSIVKNDLKIEEQESKSFTDDELTEEGDPYKQKYLKYKKKLYKLRSSKKENKQH